jgi:transposase
MVKTHEWSPTSRGKALGLRASGRVPLREITNITAIPKSTVHDINTRGTGINEARSGRPRKLSSGDIRQIIRHIRLNKSTRRLSLSALKRDLHLDVHEHTIRRALQQVGYYHRVARRRPYLNKRDRSRRLKFAKKHRDWTKEQWATVLFSDEMAVKLFMERRSKDYVWRTTEEEYHPDCINYGRRPTGVGLMFWGVFRKGKMGPGLFFDLDKGETVNSTVYRDQILLGPLQQFWEESFEDIALPIVMEDNAPVHKKVCIPAREALGMPVLDWPPNSPDLNPIENIWSYMKDIIAKDYGEVSSAAEMKKIVRDMWEQFTDTQWDKLIDSLPERMTAVIAARGGSTRY